MRRIGTSDIAIGYVSGAGKIRMAVAVGVYFETGVTKGKAYLQLARFTDTWSKQNDQWKCVAS